MGEDEWDIKGIKRLKKKKLVQTNLWFLLTFVLLAIYVMNRWEMSVLLGLCCVVMWIILGKALYTLKTGRFFGTKTSRRVEYFDREYMGEKRWKRREVTEAVILSVLNVVITVCFFVLDFDYDSVPRASLVDAFPFMGAWLGANIGEIVRMNNLS